MNNVLRVNSYADSTNHAEGLSVSKLLFCSFDLLLFAFSLINNITLIVWLIFSPILLIFFKKRKGAVLFLIELQYRSLLSTGIASSITGPAGIIKWVVIFLLSFIIIIQNFKKVSCNTSLKTAIALLLVFAIYCVISSLCKSSYPIVASFKVLSFIVPFIAILIGVVANKDYNWLSTIVVPLGFLIIGSIPLIFSATGYLRNGHAFQGCFNHPNVYGSMAALFLCGVVSFDNKKNFFVRVIVIFVCFYLIYLSGSRTSLLTATICIILSFIFGKSTKLRKILVSLLGIFAVLLLTVGSSGLFDKLTDFVFKGHLDNLFFSRQGQIQANLERFIDSPWLGTGFNVPFVEGVRMISFSFDLVTENGNLALALLGDTGVIGTLLFIISYGFLLIKGSKRKIALFVGTILVSFGEMTFFSTNNFGIIMYFFIAIFFSKSTNFYRSQKERCYLSFDYGARTGS